MNKKVSIVMYHYVRALAASRYPQIKGLDKTDFITQLDFLDQYGHFISCEQLMEAFDGGSLPENPVLLTFDDGYIDHFNTVFPILYERHIPAFFSMPGRIIAEQKVLDVNKIHFILASNPIEKLMPMVYERLDYYRGASFDIPDDQMLYNKLAQASRLDSADVIFVKRLLQVELPEQLRGLIVDDLFESCIGMDESAFAQELYMNLDQVTMMAHCGMTWGIHGYDHYWMNRLSPVELAADVNRALEVFDGIVDRNSWIFCYPYGSWSDSVVAYTRTQGCCAGFSSEVNLAEIDKNLLFHLPRLDTIDYPPRSENYLKFKKN